MCSNLLGGNDAADEFFQHRMSTVRCRPKCCWGWLRQLLGVTILATSVAIHRAARAIGPDSASVQTSGRRSAPDKPPAEHEIEPRLSIAPRLEEQEQQSVDAAAR